MTISSAASHGNGFLRPAPPILERAWESTASSLEERELAQCTEIAGAHAYTCGFETLRTSV